MSDEIGNKKIRMINSQTENRAFCRGVGLALLTKYHKHISQERIDAGHGAEHLADHVDDRKIGETVQQINREEHYCAKNRTKLIILLSTRFTSQLHRHTHRILCHRTHDTNRPICEWCTRNTSRLHE